MMLDWLTQFPAILLGTVLLVVMLVAAAIGRVLRQRLGWTAVGRIEAHEGYVIGGVMTLLGLLIGFTFALAVDRYEARRLLVVEDANAIGRLYLRAQLLEEPHRSRFSEMLVRYTDNHLRLAEAEANGEEAQRLLANNRNLLADLWTATVPAFETIRGIDFSSSFVDSVNQVIELDASRYAQRSAQIPSAVFALLFVYAVAVAFILGNVLVGPHGLTAGVILLVLFAMSFTLLSDINQPVTGTIRESQQPIQLLRDQMRQSPPARFDRLRPPAAAPAP